MTDIESIQKTTAVYAEARDLLAQHVAALQEGIEALKKTKLPAIKRAVARAAERQADLHALIASHPECFEKPRTLVFSGVKVGYQKGKGVIDFDDADAVVARIKRHLPEQADVLIKTRETPVKDALAQLTAADLKKIGASVTEAGDQVVIRPVDGEVDKLVDALLKGATDEAEAA